MPDSFAEALHEHMHMVCVRFDGQQLEPRVGTAFGDDSLRLLGDVVHKYLLLYLEL